MESALTTGKRSSRWTREPVTRRGEPAAINPTERDIEIFKLLLRYRYLPSDYICAFVGGNPKALTRRLNLLSRKPNLYLCRPAQQRANSRANHRPLIYELDQRGYRVLRERGIVLFARPNQHNFAHELMVSQVFASLELGARDHTQVRLISWPEILSSPHTPEATKRATAPASIPVQLHDNGMPRSAVIAADGQPFGIERVIRDTRTFLFFPGIEVDCGTEPIDSAQFERSSIKRKFILYTTIAEQGAYRTHFGFPNFLVPFVTATEPRMHSMMELLRRLTNGRGSKMFLFKTFPGFSAVARTKPSGQMLSDAWSRVGHEPFSFVE